MPHNLTARKIDKVDSIEASRSNVLLGRAFVASTRLFTFYTDEFGKAISDNLYQLRICSVVTLPPQSGVAINSPANRL